MEGLSTGFNFFVVVSKSEDAAMSLLGDLQAELAHNEAYSQDFGVKTDKGREWQSGRFSISDGTTFVALGRGQSLRDLKKRGRRRFFLSSGSRYRKLESLLSDLYQSPLCSCPEHLAHDNDPANPFTERDIQAAFNVVHSALKMTPELLSERPIRRVINKTADYFSGAISERMPPKMADALRQDLYVFSGFRTYHELKEASERLLRPDGSLKSFKEFYQDTLKVRDKYNKAWLKAEYNYAVRTADAAARWAEIEKDKDQIDLLYETVGDGRVRPDHAALEGVCLPVDDPFWALAYPPNGWNCRCRVLRVAKGSHPYSNSSEATDAYLEATAGKNELFRYNPGKEQRIFSDRHPYYSKRGIMHCSVKVDKLAANLDNNEECEVLRNLIKNKPDKEGYIILKGENGIAIKVHEHADPVEIEDNIRTGFTLAKAFPNLDIRIREHVRGRGIKNPEYLIDGILADAKRIKGYKGIAEGFRKAMEQEAKVVILDFDKHFRGIYIGINQVAKAITNRKIDFETDKVDYVFVVHNDVAITIDKHQAIDKEWIINALKENGL